MHKLHPNPLSETEILDLLGRSISDVGFWTWWTAALPSSIQLEFGGTQLYLPPPHPSKPPASTIAVQFKDPVSISFISSENIPQGSLPAWYDLLHDEKLKPPNCSHNGFTFTNTRLMHEIIDAAKAITTIHGAGPRHDSFWTPNYRLVFWAGNMGMAVSALQINLRSREGEIKMEQIPDMNARWWDYWKRYWGVRGTSSPLPKDYACEVTIPTA